MPAPLHTVTILGMGRSTADYAQEGYNAPIPMNSSEHQVWAMNAAACVFRCHVAFNLHNLQEEDSELQAMTELFRKSSGQFVTLVSNDPRDLIFPIKDVIEATQETYFDTSPAYLIAAAIWRKAKKIRLFGIDYNFQGAEAYERGKPCVEYWVGRARGEGIEVEIARSSTLMCTAQRMQAAQRAARGEFIAGSRYPMYGFGKNYPVTDLGLDGKVIVHGLNGDSEWTGMNLER